MTGGILVQPFKNVAEIQHIERALSKVLDLSEQISLALSAVQTSAPDSGSGRRLRVGDPGSLGLADEDRTVLAYARQLYAFRRRRGTRLPTEMFGEPAWDMLLELFVMRMQGSRVRIKNACIAASVPATTALRWIGLLEEHGLIIRSDDTVDHRVRWIELTDQAFQTMYDLLLEQALNDRAAAAADEPGERARSSAGGRR